MIIAVLVTIPKDKALALTKILLERRVCACVNIIKEVNSFFWWEGKIDQAKESYLIIKTEAKKFNSLKKLIEANHPYQVPEIVAINIAKVNKPYHAWLKAQIN